MRSLANQQNPYTSSPILNFDLENIFARIRKQIQNESDLPISNSNSNSVPDFKK